MKERPILFSAPMVNAILGGIKTQTRRAVKLNHAGRAQLGGRNWHLGDSDAIKACPYGQTGERLWVRETWGDRTKGSDIMGGTHWENPLYRANADAYGLLGHDGFGPIYEEDILWRSSIHMPRSASRISLEITGVRVERLQDISEGDAIAEGVEELDGHFNEAEYCAIAKKIGCCIGDSKPVYAQLWESLNGKGSWDLNPFVWVIEFKRIEK